MAASIGPFLLGVTVIAFVILTLWRRMHHTGTRPGEISSMSAGAAPQGTLKENSRVELGMRIFVTVAVLGAALFIILFNRNAGDQQKWAFGAVGTVLGYWLKV